MGPVGTAAAMLITGSAAAALAASHAAPEIALGLLAPLAVAVGSLRLMERAYRRGPEHLTRLMVRAFVSKILLFGVYVALAVGVAALDPAWFAGSFAISFAVLHLAEAAQLRRLFTS